MSSEPTADQAAAAEALARRYIARTGLSVEDDEAFADGVIKIHTADREGAGEEPSEALRAAFQDHAARLRALSPLIYVSSEEVDEWICLTITIRATPRKRKPDEIPKLSAKVAAALPRGISQHPRVRQISEGNWRDGRKGLLVTTDVDGQAGKIVTELTWQVTGNSVDGWELLVRWGWRLSRRPAAFKKLTPSIIVRELQGVLRDLSDPLDCLGYDAKVNKIEGLAPRPTQRMATAQRFRGRRLRLEQWERSIEVINRLTGESIELKDGDEIPGYVTEYFTTY